MDGIRNVALSFFSRVQVRLDDGDDVFVVGNGNGFFNGNRFTGEVFHSSRSGKRQEKVVPSCLLAGGRPNSAQRLCDLR